VLLTLLFYLIVTPLGLVRRLAGADPLQLSAWNRNLSSTFRERTHTYIPDDLEPPY